MRQGAEHPDLETTEQQVLLAQHYRAAFETAAGRAVLADLEARFARNAFNPENSHWTDFNCGTQHVLQTIGEQIALAYAHEGRTGIPTETTSDG